MIRLCESVIFPLWFADKRMETNNEPTKTSQRKPKKKFSQYEDNVIIAEVAKNGRHGWQRVADLLPGRTGRQIRERWVNYLSPDVDKGPWTAAEDQLLTKLATTMGRKWSEISIHFPRRTDVMIKNRWSLLKRHLMKGSKEIYPENVVHRQMLPHLEPIQVGLIINGENLIKSSPKVTVEPTPAVAREETNQKPDEEEK